MDLSDLGRFPPRQVCADRVCFLQAHIDWTVAVGSLYPSEVGAWYEYYCEVGRVRKTWLACDEAGRQEWSDSTRLQSLRELRELLGLEDYYSGRMPW